MIFTLQQNLVIEESLRWCDHLGNGSRGSFNSVWKNSLWRQRCRRIVPTGACDLCALSDVALALLHTETGVSLVGPEAWCFGRW